jgi:hypothetical protein
MPKWIEGTLEISNIFGEDHIAGSFSVNSYEQSFHINNGSMKF